MGKGQELYLEAKKIIPGGTQLLSKRPEMFLPDKWPAYYSKAHGCEVWDLDGNHYYDVSYMGVGANVLGYSNEEVDYAAKEAIDCSSMCTLNAPEEVYLARKLLKLHPWAGGVRYAKTGGESMALAIRIARSYSQKDTVLFCGYHGWHDWYLSANLDTPDALNDHHIPGLEPLGVPSGLTGTAIPFHYNDITEFKKIVNQYRTTIGVIVMEPIRNDPPDTAFMNTVLTTAKELGAVVVFDEITAGFRLCPGGSHMVLGYIPDIAVFAKGMSNGYPMAAIIGKKNIMEAAQGTFISSTYFTERVGLAAALKCIEIYERDRIWEKQISMGKHIKAEWETLAAKNSIQISIGGIDPLPHFTFLYSNSLAYKSFFIQEMLSRGFLASTAFYVSAAHTGKIIVDYMKAVDQIFGQLRAIQEKDQSIETYLSGPICHAGFGRLN